MKNLYEIHIVFLFIFAFLWGGCVNDRTNAGSNRKDTTEFQELMVGFARENITPPVGMRLCGTFEERLATGVHDSLYVKAFVFKQDQTRFVIAGCDLAMVFPEVCDSVRARIAHLGIPGKNILIHGSETHNGPDYYGEFRDVFHERAIGKYGYDPAEPFDYLQFLIEKITIAIHEADSTAKPSTLSYASGKCEGIAFNRRFKMKDGSVGWNPGKLNPQIVSPLGPVDEKVPVLMVYQGSTAMPAALLTGYAMHLAILEDSEYGADYPYYLDQNLKEKISPELFTHFLQSPCCEVNHIDVNSPEPQTGYEWAGVVGAKLASSVQEAIDLNQSKLTPDLKAGSTVVTLELQDYSKMETDEQRNIWYSPDRADRHFLEVVHAGKVSNIVDRHNGGPVSCLLQAFQIDEATAIAGIPSEVSVELGLYIKEHSPYANTILVQLSNDWFGYVPPVRIFEEGHYEAAVAKIKPGEGEKLADAVLELLSELDR